MAESQVIQPVQLEEEVSPAKGTGLSGPLFRPLGNGMMMRTIGNYQRKIKYPPPGDVKDP